LRPGWVAEHGLHCDVVGEDLGGDLPSAVQPLEKLELVGRQREHDGESLTTLPDEVVEPRRDLSPRGRQIGSQHRHEIAKRICPVALHVIG